MPGAAAKPPTPAQPPPFVVSRITDHDVCSKCAAVVPHELTAAHADWHKRAGS